MATVDLGLVKGADGAAGANGADGVRVRRQQYYGADAMSSARDFCFAHYDRIIGVYASANQINPVLYQVTMKIEPSLQGGLATFYLPDGSSYTATGDDLIDVYYLE